MTWVELQWYASDENVSKFWLMGEYIKLLQQENLYLKKALMDLYNKEVK